MMRRRSPDRSRRQPPAPIDRGTRQQRPYSADSSSSSASLVDISRHYPRAARIGAVLSTFFRAPSERTPHQHHQRRRRRRRRIFSFGNASSSSSINSDLAYGNGYVARPKDYPPSRHVAADDARTDEEILDIGRQLSHLARRQNQRDLRAAGKSPSSLSALSTAAAAATVTGLRRKRSTSARRGTDSSAPRPPASDDDDDDDDDDWESASEDESSDAADSELAYGSALAQPAAPLRNRHNSAVDPRLFGPVNSLRGLVTPRPFSDDESALPAAQHHHFNRLRRLEPADERTPMRELRPIPTADPNSFDVDTLSSTSLPQARPRPAPVPLQQPVPKAPVKPNVFEADKLDEQREWREPRQRSEKDLDAVKGATVAAVALGTVVAAEKKDHDKDERRMKSNRHSESERRHRHKSPERSERRHADSDRRHRHKSPERPTRSETGSSRREQDADRDREHRRSSKRDSHSSSKRSSDDRYSSSRRSEDQQPRDKSTRSGDETRRGKQRDTVISYAAASEAPRRRRDDIVIEPEPERRDAKTASRDGGSYRHDRGDDHRRPVDYDPGSRPRDAEDRRSAREKEKAPINPFQFQVRDDDENYEIVAPKPSPPRVDRERFDDWSPTPSQPGQRRSKNDSVDEQQRSYKGQSKRRQEDLPEGEPGSYRHRNEKRGDNGKRADEHVRDSAGHGIAPAAIAAAVAAAVGASRSRERRRRRDEESDGHGSRERDDQSRDPIQEEANRYYRENARAQKTAPGQDASRPRESDDFVASGAWNEDFSFGHPTIVTPPRKTEDLYGAPDADVRIDNKIYPRDITRFRSAAGETRPALFSARDPSCERDRPLLNLVFPTPDCSRHATPGPDAARVEDESNHPVEPSPPEEPIHSAVGGSRGEVVVTQPSTPKSVTWGENSTKRFEVESPEPRSDVEYVGREVAAQPTERPRPSLEKTSRWGAMADAFTGTKFSEPEDDESRARESEKPSPKARDIEKPSSNRELRDGKDMGRSSQVSIDESSTAAPPVPGPKPERMPGGFSDDIDFAATLAAGLQDSGFDPDIVINDPAYRRRDSPPGESEPNGDDWGSKATIMSPKKGHDAPGEKVVGESGRASGEADLSRDEPTVFDEQIEMPKKLSKKERRRLEKEKLEKQALDAAAPEAPSLVSAMPAVEAKSAVEAETPADDGWAEVPKNMSKREQKRLEKLERQASDAAVSSETPPPLVSSADAPRKVSKKEQRRLDKEKKAQGMMSPKDKEDAEIVVESRRSPAAEDDDWEEADGKKKSKKGGKEDTGIVSEPRRPSEAEDDDWEEAGGKKKSNKGRKNRGFGEDDDDDDDAAAAAVSKVSVPTDAFDDLQSLKKASPDDDWEMPGKHKKGRKRDPHDSPTPFAAPSEMSTGSSSHRRSRKSKQKGGVDDGGYSSDEPPSRQKRNLFEDRDVSSVVSEPRYDERKHERRAGKRRSSRHGDAAGDNEGEDLDDDAKSAASAPGPSRHRSKEPPPEKKAGGRFSSFFKPGGSKEKDEAKKDSFFESAGTFGAGVGLAEAAAGLVRPHATTERSSTERERDALETPITSVRAEESNDALDPDIAPRAIKPAIDPQYGDLLPLPPSEPGSPREAPAGLPSLPDSRPSTPPDERSWTRRDYLTRHHRRGRSMQEIPTNNNNKTLARTPTKTPSSTAIPLSWRLGQRGSPTTPSSSTFRSVTAESPVAGASDVSSSSKRRARHVSWDSSREMIPLCLLRQPLNMPTKKHSPPERQQQQQEEGGGEEVSFADGAIPSSSELPPIPSSEPLSRQSPAPEPDDADDGTVLEGCGLGTLGTVDPRLRLDMGKASASEGEDSIGSAETTPKAELQPELPVLPPLDDEDGHHDHHQQKEDEKGETQQFEPDPVESTSKNRSSYLLLSSSPSIGSNNSVDRECALQSPTRSSSPSSKQVVGAGGAARRRGVEDLNSPDSPDEHFSDAMEGQPGDEVAAAAEEEAGDDLLSARTGIHPQEEVIGLGDVSADVVQQNVTDSLLHPGEEEGADQGLPGAEAAGFDIPASEDTARETVPEQVVDTSSSQVKATSVDNMYESEDVSPGTLERLFDTQLIQEPASPVENMSGSNETLSSRDAGLAEAPADTEGGREQQDAGQAVEINIDDVATPGDGHHDIAEDEEAAVSQSDREDEPHAVVLHASEGVEPPFNTAAAKALETVEERGGEQNVARASEVDIGDVPISGNGYVVADEQANVTQAGHEEVEPDAATMPASDAFEPQFATNATKETKTVDEPEEKRDLTVASTADLTPDVQSVFEAMVANASATKNDGAQPMEEPRAVKAPDAARDQDDKPELDEDQTRSKMVSDTDAAADVQSVYEAMVKAIAANDEGGSEPREETRSIKELQTSQKEEMKKQQGSSVASDADVLSVSDVMIRNAAVSDDETGPLGERSREALGLVPEQDSRELSSDLMAEARVVEEAVRQTAAVSDNDDKEVEDVGRKASETEKRQDQEELPFTGDTDPTSQIQLVSEAMLRTVNDEAQPLAETDREVVQTFAQDHDQQELSSTANTDQTKLMSEAADDEAPPLLETGRGAVQTSVEEQNQQVRSSTDETDQMPPISEVMLRTADDEAQPLQDASHEVLETLVQEEDQRDLSSMGSTDQTAHMQPISEVMPDTTALVDNEAMIPEDTSREALEENQPNLSSTDNSGAAALMQPVSEAMPGTATLAEIEAMPLVDADRLEGLELGEGQQKQDRSMAGKDDPVDDAQSEPEAIPETDTALVDDEAVPRGDTNRIQVWDSAPANVGHDRSVAEVQAVFEAMVKNAVGSENEAVLSEASAVVPGQEEGDRSVIADTDVNHTASRVAPCVTREHHEVGPGYHEGAPDDDEFAPEHRQVTPEHHELTSEHHEAVPIMVVTDPVPQEANVIEAMEPTRLPEQQPVNIDVRGIGDSDPSFQINVWEWPKAQETDEQHNVTSESEASPGEASPAGELEGPVTEVKPVVDDNDPEAVDQDAGSVSAFDIPAIVVDGSDADSGPANARNTDEPIPASGNVRTHAGIRIIDALNDDVSTARSADVEDHRGPDEEQNVTDIVDQSLSEGPVPAAALMDVPIIRINSPSTDSGLDDADVDEPAEISDNFRTGAGFEGPGFSFDEGSASQVTQVTRVAEVEGSDEPYEEADVAQVPFIRIDSPSTDSGLDGTDMGQQAEAGDVSRTQAGYEGFRSTFDEVSAVQVTQVVKSDEPLERAETAQDSPILRADSPTLDLAKDTNEPRSDDRTALTGDRDLEPEDDGTLPTQGTETEQRSEPSEQDSSTKVAEQPTSTVVSAEDESREGPESREKTNGKRNSKQRNKKKQKKKQGRGSLLGTTTESAPVSLREGESGSAVDSPAVTEAEVVDEEAMGPSSDQMVTSADPIVAPSGPVDDAAVQADTLPHQVLTSSNAIDSSSDMVDVSSRQLDSTPYSVQEQPDLVEKDPSVLTDVPTMLVNAPSPQVDASGGDPVVAPPSDLVDILPVTGETPSDPAKEQSDLVEARSILPDGPPVADDAASTQSDTPTGLVEASSDLVHLSPVPADASSPQVDAVAHAARNQDDSAEAPPDLTDIGPSTQINATLEDQAEKAAEASSGLIDVPPVQTAVLSTQVDSPTVPADAPTDLLDSPVDSPDSPSSLTKALADMIDTLSVPQDAPSDSANVLSKKVDAPSTSTGTSSTAMQAGVESADSAPEPLSIAERSPLLSPALVQEEVPAIAAEEDENALPGSHVIPPTAAEGTAESGDSDQLSSSSGATKGKVEPGEPIDASWAAGNGMSEPAELMKTVPQESFPDGLAEDNSRLDEVLSSAELPALPSAMEIEAELTEAALMGASTTASDDRKEPAKPMETSLQDSVPEGLEQDVTKFDEASASAQPAALPVAVMDVAEPAGPVSSDTADDKTKSVEGIPFNRREPSSPDSVHDEPKNDERASSAGSAELPIAMEAGVELAQPTMVKTSSNAVKDHQDSVKTPDQLEPSFADPAHEELKRGKTTPSAESHASRLTEDDEIEQAKPPLPKASPIIDENQEKSAENFPLGQTEPSDQENPFADPAVEEPRQSETDPSARTIVSYLIEDSEVEEAEPAGVGASSTATDNEEGSAEVISSNRVGLSDQLEQSDQREPARQEQPFFATPSKQPKKDETHEEPKYDEISTAKARKSPLQRDDAVKPTEPTSIIDEPSNAPDNKAKGAEMIPGQPESSTVGVALSTDEATDKANPKGRIATATGKKAADVKAATGVIVGKVSLLAERFGGSKKKRRGKAKVEDEQKRQKGDVLDDQARLKDADEKRPETEGGASVGRQSSGGVEAAAEANRSLATLVSESSAEPEASSTGESEEQQEESPVLGRNEPVGLLRREWDAEEPEGGLLEEQIAEVMSEVQSSGPLPAVQECPEAEAEAEGIKMDEGWPLRDSGIGAGSPRPWGRRVTRGVQRDSGVHTGTEAEERRMPKVRAGPRPGTGAGAGLGEKEGDGEGAGAGAEAGPRSAEEKEEGAGSDPQRRNRRSSGEVGRQGSPFRPESPGINDSFPPLRRVSSRSATGDLRRFGSNSNIAAERKPKPKSKPKPASSSPPSSSSSPSSSPTPVANEGRVRAMATTDVLDGFGEGRVGSPMSPTRPHSMRRRQSMQVLELEARVDQLLAENRLLIDGRARAEAELTARAAAAVSARDGELESLRQSLRFSQAEVARLAEVNDGLASANAELAARDNRDASLADATARLDVAEDQIRRLQRELVDAKTPGFLRLLDEDHFEGRCQRLSSHVRQWVIRFSKFSDMRPCRLTDEIDDDKTVDRLDDAILDGTDVDLLLRDRVRRRDVFMSVTMNMIWEFVFTRYLFGMDREQRQKLKSLEKLLSDVGPAQAVRQWRCVTLTLLARREGFHGQRELDTEAVVQAIYQTLSRILPPPLNLEAQVQSQLRRVVREAVDLSIEMRTQRAEYVMLPPSQPEYDAEGKPSSFPFDASTMTVTAGAGTTTTTTTTNTAAADDEDEKLLEDRAAVVRLVLFPLVVKKGDDQGLGDENIVISPAQVLVASDDDERIGSAAAARHVTPSSDAGGASLAAPSRVSLMTERSIDVHSDVRHHHLASGA
ncbi:hypothetical protein CP532_6301 [Ophiocordyceps camponoti-leonardi (nom. inval.)]|nr:hypothetical protein CP532_6301 [Ophiocordyceps camponoti-leonardi (nom. inval.)]